MRGCRKDLVRPDQEERRPHRDRRAPEHVRACIRRSKTSSTAPCASSLLDPECFAAKQFALENARFVSQRNILGGNKPRIVSRAKQFPFRSHPACRPCPGTPRPGSSAPGPCPCRRACAPRARTPGPAGAPGSAATHGRDRPIPATGPDPQMFRCETICPRKCPVCFAAKHLRGEQTGNCFARETIPLSFSSPDPAPARLPRPRVAVAGGRQSR